MRAIECRAYEIGHACIDNDKLLCRSLLDIEATCNKRAALTYNSPSKFKVKMLAGTKFQMFGVCIEIRLKVWNRMVVRSIIVNTQTTTDIYVLHLDTFCFKPIL